MASPAAGGSTSPKPAAAAAAPSSPRLSPRLVEDLRRASPVWDENFDQLARSMQERMDDFFRTPQPMMSSMQQQQSSSSSGAIRGRFENQQDGSILYKVTFDVQGYEPQDLKTSLVAERTVRVCGSSNRQDPQTGAQTSASFDEQFALPDNVDPTRLRSVVANNQLFITAPVLPPQYASAGGGGRTQPPQQQPHHQQQQQQQHYQSQTYTSSPRLSPRSGSPSAFGQPAVSHHQQQQLHEQQQGSVRTVSAYQLEVDVGREFEPQDLTVATTAGGRRLTVHGRREVKAAGKSSMREFRDEFDLPASVDPALVTARLRSDGRIVVDMPLLREAAGLTYWPVAVDHRG